MSILTRLRADRNTVSPAFPHIPRRRLPIHPLIAQRLLIEHDGYGAIVWPLGEYMDLSGFWPVLATVHTPPAPKTEPDLTAWREQTHGRDLTAYHDQTVIGALPPADHHKLAKPRQLCVLTAAGSLFYAEPGDLTNLTVLDLTEER